MRACAYIDFGVDFYLTTHISSGPLATNRERNRIERAKTPRSNKSAHLYYRRELRGNMRALNLAATAPHAITRHRIIFIRSAEPNENDNNGKQQQQQHDVLYNCVESIFMSIPSYEIIIRHL